MKDQTVKDLDIEIQYQHYLKLTGLFESTMHPTQKVETKRAFMAGFGQMIILMLEVVSEIEDEDRAVLHLEDLFNQTQMFWKNEGKTA